MKFTVRSVSHILFKNIVRRKILIFSLIALLVILPISYMVFKNKSNVEAAWMDDQWGYRQTIAITNSGTAQTDFQVPVTLNTSALITAGKMQSDCDDIRITDVNGKVLAHWIQTGTNACNSATTKIWTNVPSISITGATVFLYYGNPSATNTENGKSTFIYFEDFTSITGWTAYGTGGTISQPSAGLIQMNNPSSSCRIWTTPATNIPSITNSVLEMRYALANAAGAEGGPLTRVGSDSTNGAIDGYQIALRGRGSNDMPVWRMDNMSTGCGGLTNINSNYGAGWSVPITFQVGKIIMNGSTQTWYPDIDSHAATFTSWTDAAYSSGSIGFWEYSTSDLQGDWIFARKFSSTEPSVATPANEQKSPAPVAYWKFDEGYGTATQDSSPNNKSLTLSSSTTWASEDQCISGKCLKFDGTSTANVFNTSFDYNILKQGQETGSWTMAVWAKPSGSQAGGERVIMGRAGCHGGIYANANSIDFAIKTDGCWTNYKGITYTPTDMQSWHYLVAVYNNRAMSFYANGKLVGTNNFSATTYAYSNTMYLGGIGTYAFKGFIDEPKIYPYARTAAQIKSDFASKGSGSVKGTSANLGSSSKNLDSLSNGLVGYWKMDEASGNAIDSSGNGNTGTLTGAPTSVAGSLGPAKNFANTAGVAASDYYNVTTTTGLSADAITVSAWINPDVITSGERQCFINSPGTFFDIEPGGSLVAYIQTTPTGWIAQSTTGLQTGVWQHVVQTYDRKTRNLYINGVLKSSVIDRTEALINTGATRVGDATWGGEAYDGKIDEVRIYNRALSPKEVRDLYNWAPGPVGYWNMDEGTGINANDLSGNGITGTLQSSPTWTTGKFGKGLNFNGTSQYITTSSNPLTYFTASKGYTVESWVKLDQYQPNPGCCGSRIAYTNSGNGGFDWRIWNNGVVNFYRPTTWCAAGSSVTVPLNQWTHLAATYNNQQVYVYMNGIRVASTNSCNFLDSTAGIVFNYPGGNHGLYGSMDDSKVYNYARTPKQIVEDMNAGHPIGGSPVGSQVGYWKFDEGYGITANNSGSGSTTYNGTITGATWNNDGKFGKALRFDGTTNSISVSSINPPTQVTVSAWFRRKGTPGTGYHIIYTQGTQIEISVPESTGQIRTGVTTATMGRQVFNSGSGVVDGNWHHLSLTYDGNYLKSYIDGKQTASNPVTGALSTGSSTTIGYLSGGYATNGLIDEVKIYNAALTEDEIKLDYNRGSAMVLGTMSDTSNLTGGSVASSSASAAYCIPGGTTTCNPPVGEWNFEEGTGGSVNDTSGNGNLGNWSNGTGVGNWANGKMGKAGSFNGSSDYVTVTAGAGAPLDIDSNPITMEAWIKPNSLTGEQHIISRGQRGVAGYGLAINYSGGLVNVGLHGGGNFNGTTTLVVGQWYHIVGIINGASSAIYINGKLDATGTVNVVATNLDFHLGSAWNGSIQSYFFNGSLDQVRIFNYARTPAQIAYDYNRGGPIAHYKFDECQGITANDSSGNNNTGTITIGASGSQTAVGTCTTSGTAWYNGVTGKYNSSLNFDGTDDTVLVPYSSSLNPTNSISITAWVKPNVVTAYKEVLRQEETNRKLLSFQPEGATGTALAFGLTIGGSYTELDAPITASEWTNGNWHFITATFNGSVKKVYDNGKEIGSENISGALGAGAQPIYIGSSSGGSEFFNGQIDDVKIFNYALTGSQIKGLYNSGATVQFAPATGSP